jgi:hypothetical protein
VDLRQRTAIVTGAVAGNAYATTKAALKAC